MIPNGTDLELLPYRPPLETGNAIVFIGNMVSAQNQDACHYFARNILPAVRAKAPVTGPSPSLEEVFSQGKAAIFRVRLGC